MCGRLVLVGGRHKKPNSKIYARKTHKTSSTRSPSGAIKADPAHLKELINKSESGIF